MNIQRKNNKNVFGAKLTILDANLRTPYKTNLGKDLTQSQISELERLAKPLGKKKQVIIADIGTVEKTDTFEQAPVAMASNIDGKLQTDAAIVKFDSLDAFGYKNAQTSVYDVVKNYIEYLRDIFVK